MLDLGSEYQTLAQSRVLGSAVLVEAHFTTGVQRWTSWATNLEWAGNTFIGLGTLGTVSDLKEGTSGAGDKVTLTLSPVPPERLSLALGNVESYRGRPVNIFMWAVGPNFQPVGTPILRHAGVMDQVSIKRDKDQGSVELACLPAGANGTRRAVGLRISHAQHRLTYPTERGLEYAAGLVNQPQLWLSKRFQEI